MANNDGLKANEEAQKVQSLITQQWQNFATLHGRAAYEDLLSYIDDQRELYRRYAEERAMPHPNGSGDIPLDNETVAALLQNSRGLNIVRTYITNRVNAGGVAQPTKSK